MFSLIFTPQYILGFSIIYEESRSIGNDATTIRGVWNYCVSDRSETTDAQQVLVSL